MNRRVGVGVAVAGLVVGLGLWWWLQQDPVVAGPEGVAAEPSSATTTKVPGSPSRPGEPASLPGAVSAPGKEVLPAWIAQPEAPARRVAGHVTFEGKPVANALVRLSPQQQPVGVASVDVRTAADGAFDLGLQPPLEYRINASSPGLTDALTSLDLRDPAARPAPDALELLLTACDARLVGHVFDSGGGAIEHARVYQPGSPGAETNVKGEFELCLPPGQNRVHVEAAGYGTLRVFLLVLGRTVRDLRLIPEAFIVGRVVLASDGTAVPGAMVSAWPAQFTNGEAPAGADALAGADGRFRLSVAPGDYKILGWSADAASATPSRVTALVGRLSDEVTLRLQAAPTLRGHVRRAGKPVAGAKVAAILTAGSRHAEALSQADGSFVMRRAPPGEVVFTAAPYAVLAPKKFIVPKVNATVELEVKNQGSLRGLVTARGGKPVVDATIKVSSGLQFFETTSGPDGRYVQAGLPAGSWTVLADSVPVGGFVELKGIKLADGEDKELDLALSSAATISGRVVSAEGTPVPGAVVVYVHTVTSDEGRSVADADGQFFCTQMTGGGEYLPKVYPSPVSRTPYAPAGAAFAPVKLADGSAQVEGITLAVKYERLSISGRVVDPSGTPIPDAKVRAMAVSGGEAPRFNQFTELPSSSTDAQGAFSVEPLTSGTWALQARTPEGAEAIAPAVAAGSKDVVITVRPPGIIEGTLVGYESPPVIYATDLAANGFVPGLVEGSTFKLTLRAGAYLVTAMNTKEGDAKRVELKEGVTTKVTMTSHGHGVLSGLVVEHVSRAPVPDLTCHAVLAAGGRGGITNWDVETAPKTDATGRFTDEQSPAGDLEVTCMGDWSELSSGSANVVLARGGRAEVVIEVVRRRQGEAPGDVGLELDEQEAGRVLAVRPGSPGAKAGVAPGDLVTGVDGLANGTLSGDGVDALISNHPPGTPLKLTVVRGGQAREVALIAVGRGQ